MEATYAVIGDDGIVENIVVMIAGQTELHGKQLVVLADDDDAKIGDAYDAEMGFPKKPVPTETSEEPLAEFTQV